MRKDVLVSLLAASMPMAALANADVTGEIKTSKVEDWTADTEKIKLEGSVFVSQSGAPMSQLVKNLVQGKYRLTLKEAVNVKINGKAPEANMVEFELKAGETELKLEVTAAEADKEWKLGIDKFELVFEFDNLRKEIEPSLSELFTKINSLNDGEAKKAGLLESASAIAARLAKVSDSDKDNFTVYGLEELFKGATECKITKSIEGLLEEYNEIANNSNNYFYAKPLVEGLQTAFAEYVAKYDKATDYAKGKHGAEFDALKSEIEAYATALKAAYEATEAGKDEYKEENVDKAIDGFKSRITKLESDVNASNDDDAAYNEVLKLIEGAQTAFNDNLKALIAGLGDVEDLYKNFYLLGQSRLTAELNAVLALSAEDKNGTADKHDSAYETKGANETVISNAKKNMAGIVTNFTNQAATENAAFETATTEMKALQASFDAAVKEIEVVKEQFAEATATIQGDIDALNVIIGDKNKAHVISKYIAEQEYTEKKGAINTKIAKLKADAATPIANFNANKELVEKVFPGLTEHLDTTVTIVNGLKSKDEVYKANGKYTKKSTEFEKTIKGYVDGLEAAKKDGGIGAYAYQKDNEGNFAATINAINKFKEDAKALVAKYEAIDAAIEECNVELAKLENVNGDVVVLTDGNAYKGKTYAEAKKALGKRIETEQTELDKAVAATEETDPTHVAAMNALSVDPAIKTTIQSLVENYAYDEGEYNGKLVDDAIENANTLIGNQLTKVRNEITTAKDTWKPELLGNRYDVIINDSIGTEEEGGKGILGKVYTLSKAAADAYANKGTNASAALAMLNTVTTGTGALEAELNALKTLVNGIMADVQDNKDKLGVANTMYNELNTLINGDGDKKLSIAQVAVDSTKKTYFEGKMKDLNKRLGDIKTAYGQSFLDEEIVKHWTDWKNDKDETVDGYSKQFTNLESDIEKTIDEAKAAAKNYQAKTTVENEIKNKDFTKLFADEKTEINDVAGEGAVYYTGTVIEVELKGKLNKIESDLATVYNANTAVDAKTGLINRINALVDEIKAVSVTAETNKKTYDELAGAVNTAQTDWANLNLDVTTKDESSKKQERLDRLAAVQTKLVKLSATLLEKCKAGQSVAYKSEANSIISAANTEIDDVRKMGDKENYNATIAADNKKVWDAFEVAWNDADATYLDAMSTIGQYANLGNEAYRKALEDVVTAHNDINAYSATLATLKNDAWTEYTTTEAGKLFDEEEDNKKAALGHKAAIETKLAAFTDTINLKSDSIRNEHVVFVKAELAKVSGGISDYLPVNQEGAFSEANTFIKDLENLASKPKRAILLDAMLNREAEVVAGITTEYLAISADECTSRAEGAAKINADNVAGIQKMVFGDFDTEDYVNKYNDTANPLLVTLNVALSEARAAIAGKDVDITKAKMKALLQAYKTFENGVNAKYEEIKALDVKQKENQTAYDGFVEDLNPLKVKLVALDEFVGNYCLVYGATQASDIRNDIKKFETALKGHYEARECNDATVSKTLADSIATIDGKFIPAYQSVNTSESSALASQVASAKNEYVRASGLVAGSENVEAVENLYKEILAIEAERSETAKEITKADADQNAIQAKFIELEGRLADVRTELARYYDAELAGTISANLTTQLEGYKAEYAKYAGYVAKYERMGKQFDADLAAWNAKIVEAETFLTKNIEDEAVIFYQAKLQEKVDLCKLADVLKMNMEEEYTSNENNASAYNGLVAALGELEAGANAVAAELNAYKYKKQSVEDTDEWTLIQEQLELAEAAIETRNAEFTESVAADGKPACTANLINDYKDEVNKQLKALQNAYTTYACGELVKELNNAISTLETSMGNNKYVESEKAKVEKKVGEIKTDITEIENYYNIGIANGWLDFDIDGKPIEWAAVTTKEMYDAVFAKVEELNADLVEQSDNLAAAKYMLGDVNDSGSVNVADYDGVRQIVLGLDEDCKEGTAKFAAADVTESGTINISDVTQIAQYIMGDIDEFKPRAASKAIAKAKALGLTDNGSLMFATEGSGLLQTIKLAVNSSLQFVGAQFDVVLPEGVKIASVASSSHDALFNVMANGTTRVLVSNLENVEIANGQTFVELQIEVSSDFKGGEILVDNALFADADGLAYSLGVAGGEATGITNLTTTEKIQSKVYSVGGQLMNKMKKGLNIIVGSDGTVKKQVIK